MGNDKAVKAGNTNIKIKLTPVDRSFYVVVDVYLAICGIIVLLPLLHVLAQSLSDPMMVIAGRVSFFPINPTLDIYSQVIKSQNIMTGFMNTLFYAGVGTCLNLFMTVICAYPLARKGLWGRKVIVFIFTFTMMFGGGMIPTYLVIKQLGLIDTRAVMILPGAITVWNMIMCRTYFMSSIPEELYESASLDGASDIRILVSMVVPLSVPILAVMVLFYGVAQWNSWFPALLYISDRGLYPLQMVLREVLIQSDISNMAGSSGDVEIIGDGLKYATMVVATLPIMCLYPFLQKYFVKGVMIGAVKG